MTMFSLPFLRSVRRIAHRRTLHPRSMPVAAEILEDRTLLDGDAFNVTFEGFLQNGAANYSAQLVGNFDFQNGDDIASFDQTSGQWYVSLNNGTGDFTTTAWGAPYGSTMGWQTHVVGDFNGDFRDDIASFHPSNGTWWISHSNAAGNSFDPVVNPISYATAAGWQSHLVADFNQDGRDDIASFHPFNGTWWINYSNAAAQNTGALSMGFQEEQNQITYTTPGGWGSHVVGNFGGNGRPDIASFQTSNGTWQVSLGDAGMTNTGAISPGFQEEKIWDDFMTDSGWTYQAAEDFNNDGFDDIVNFHPMNDTFHVSLSNHRNEAFPVADRESFATRQWSQLPSGNWTKHLHGNFNGNAGRNAGRDVASFDSNTGQWHVGVSNGGQFETDVWSDFGSNSGWTHQNAGNFQNTGFDDGIMNFHPINNSLWQSVGHFGIRQDTDVAINDSALATSNINVAFLAGTIIDVNVRIDLDHTFLGDLNIVLVSPSGTSVSLISDLFGGTDDLESVFFDDEAALAASAAIAPANRMRLRPEGWLEKFDGEDPNGTWTLRIFDDAGGDTGTLNFWDLIIKTAV